MFTHSEISPGGNMKKSDLLENPPMPCDFKCGDIVTFTNHNGVVFKGLKVIGFSEPTKWGQFIHLDTDSWWFPHSSNELELEINQAS